MVSTLSLGKKIFPILMFQKCLSTLRYLILPTVTLLELTKKLIDLPFFLLTGRGLCYGLRTLPATLRGRGRSSVNGRDPLNGHKGRG